MVFELYSEGKDVSDMTHLIDELEDIKHSVIADSMDTFDSMHPVKRQVCA